MRINQNATTQDIYNRYNESLNQRKSIEKVSRENSIDNNQTSSGNKISITAYKEETSEKVSRVKSANNNQTSATDTLETSEKMKEQSDNGKYEINHPDQVIKQAQLNGLSQANQSPTVVLDLLR